MALLILKQGDLGMTAMILIFICDSTVYLWNQKKKKRYLFRCPIVGLLGILTLALFYAAAPIARLDGVSRFPKNTRWIGAYQVWQAADRSRFPAGPSGLGAWATGRQKMYYLPEKRTPISFFPICWRKKLGHVGLP